MKKKALLYVLASVLFVFSMAMLVTHFREMPLRMRNATTSAVPPFNYSGKVTKVDPSGEAAGLKVGDVILAMNGRVLDSNDVFFEEIDNSGQVGSMNLSVRRDTDGATSTIDLVIPVEQVEKGASYYAQLALGFLYSFFIPAFCILVGFWVVFVRIDDFLAWMLLLIMLGFGCIGIEGSGNSASLSSVYAQIFFSTWALSMLLFALYFPERFHLDIRFPWAKWILIVPLAAQIVFTLLNVLRVTTGLPFPNLIASIGPAAGTIGLIANMTGLGMFFMILGWKSGTLENPDSRRRLRLMVWGTSVAMFPSFLLFIYGLATGANGSFYDRTNWLIAFIALLLMLVFPLTLAYVIVVHRAMDVRVVVRQGLQYAFATGGIRLLQFAMLLAIGLAVRWMIGQYGFGLAAQVAIIVVGISLVPLIDLIVRRLRVWIDRRFFREAYNAEQILTDLSDDVRTMVETQPLLETVAGKISESLHVPQVSLLLKQGDRFVPAYSLGFDTAPKVALGGESKTMRKLADNQHIVLYEDMTEVTSTPTMSLSDREQLVELNSQVLLPVASKNVLSGIISLSPKRSEEPYTASDLRLLRSVATQTGFALENSRLTAAVASEAAQKERLNTELEIAREVQERLFPQELPLVAGLDYYGSCRPALGVGGDYYDFLELPEGKFGIAIGDISGKGVGASLMMASLQASLRGQVIHFGNDLAGLMSQVNSLVYEASTTNRYATFFYAQYDPATRHLSYVNGGHNPPFLIRANGGVDLLEDGGPVVGMLPPILVNYTQGEVQLEPGDLLIGYTDGISEAMNPAEEEWSEESLLERLKQVRDHTAAEILPLIVASADKFANGAKQHDDMTMIVVKVL